MIGDMIQVDNATQFWVCWKLNINKEQKFGENSVAELLHFRALAVNKIYNFQVWT